MKSFDQLYRDVQEAAVEDKLNELLENPEKMKDYDKRQLDCLLHPEKLPPVLQLAQCLCEGEGRCKDACIFNAIEKDERGNLHISDRDCVGCAACIEVCEAGNLTDRKDLVPIFETLYRSNAPVYAMIAPAFVGQFSQKVTPGKLRSAFKKLGFEGMVEVALFADILTLKEALEFDRSIQTEEDYVLTSCCCPMWIGMIRKVYSELVPHIPPSVSPMVACGRTIKKLHPEAKTVFIGPCLAKKAEAREADVKDSTDFVLTFQEMQEIFRIAGIDLEQMEDDDREHSSRAGRIYARSGGVSEAVKNSVQRLNPGREIPLTAQSADGVPACKEMLNKILSGEVSANFIEGMGCRGGCVGGPKRMIDPGEATEHVDQYGDQAPHTTPVDNPYVMKLLNRLGFRDVESLLEDENMFVRHFDQ